MDVTVMIVISVVAIIISVLVGLKINKFERKKRIEKLKIQPRIQEGLSNKINGCIRIENRGKNIDDMLSPVKNISVDYDMGLEEFVFRGTPQ